MGSPELWEAKYVLTILQHDIFVFDPTGEREERDDVF